VLDAHLRPPSGCRRLGHPSNRFSGVVTLTEIFGALGDQSDGWAFLHSRPAFLLQAGTEHHKGTWHVLAVRDLCVGSVTRMARPRRPHSLHGSFSSPVAASRERDHANALRSVMEAVFPRRPTPLAVSAGRIRAQGRLPPVYSSPAGSLGGAGAGRQSLIHCASTSFRKGSFHIRKGPKGELIRRPRTGPGRHPG
jgi:hypothetical protein